ncbi:MAG TPA: hypothetical protein VIV60_18215, partial [Polyangiaceae bacterium]
LCGAGGVAGQCTNVPDLLSFVTTQYTHSPTIAQRAFHTFSINNAGSVAAQGISVRFLWSKPASLSGIASLVTSGNFVCHTVGTNLMFELDCDFGILPPLGSARITAEMVYQPSPTPPVGNTETIAIYTFLDPGKTIVEYSESNNDSYATFTVNY